MNRGVRLVVMVMVVVAVVCGDISDCTNIILTQDRRFPPGPVCCDPRIGRCPTGKCIPQRLSGLPSRVQKCFCDGHCPGQQKCCFDACGENKVCMRPEL